MLINAGTEWNFLKTMFLFLFVCGFYVFWVSVYQEHFIQYWKDSDLLPRCTAKQGYAHSSFLLKIELEDPTSTKKPENKGMYS